MASIDQKNESFWTENNEKLRQRSTDINSSKMKQISSEPRRGRVRPSNNPYSRNKDEGMFPVLDKSLDNNF